MTAAPNSPLVEKVARKIADVQRESEGKPPFTDEEWGNDFWIWYQELKGIANGGSFVHQSWPAKLERQAQAALAACEAEAMLDALRRIKEHTDPEPPEENYRADDREGCLDTVFSIASTAIARLDAKPAAEAV